MTGNSDATAPRRRVLLNDVAKLAKVSDSTASRALAGDQRISLATRETVRAAAAELRYVPNAAARSLRVRRTRTLGLVLPDLRDPVHGQVASAFEQEARQRGYGVMIVAGEKDLARERLALRIFSEHQTDGVAIVSCVISPKDAQERADPGRLVFVQPDHRSLFRHDGPRIPGVIQTDDAGGARSAVNHLVDSGYRRIAYVEGGVRASNTVRAEAVARTLKERGIRSAPHVYASSGEAWRDPGELAATIAADLPEALVCYDDKLALALMDALRVLGVRIPDDLGIVGFDGIPFAGISNPRLTTVAVPSAEMGLAAATDAHRGDPGRRTARRGDRPARPGRPREHADPPDERDPQRPDPRWSSGRIGRRAAGRSMTREATAGPNVELEQLARRGRLLVVESVAHSGAGHTGGPLSAMDLLIALFFRVLRIRPEEPDWPERDRFILSKGHSAIGLYAAMALRGYFPVEELSTFDSGDSRLQGHPDMTRLPGLEASTGSLGQGLAVGLGIALGARLRGLDPHTFVMLGDGELQEGMVWESIAVAAKYELGNLSAIVDRNRLQQYGWAPGGDPDARGDRRDPWAGVRLREALEAFGWRVLEIDGHDFDAIVGACADARAAAHGSQPTAILAETVKGRGLSFAEGRFEWHARVATADEAAAARLELGPTTEPDA